MAERPTRTHEGVTASLGRDTKQSRQQAEASKDRAASQRPQVGPPVAADGYPLVKVALAAAELIPTGQFANISVGPVLVEWWIDPREDEPIPKAEMENVTKVMNMLSDLVQIDVIAVQRNLVLESMQNQVAADGNSK